MEWVCRAENKLVLSFIEDNCRNYTRVKAIARCSPCKFCY